MNRGKRQSTTVFSRDEIGVEQLQSLKEKFADGDLNEKEFVNLFREIIDASLSETQLTELFQKIDANSDGTVDWDELTNYMFLSGSDNSSEFIGDDANAFYETYQPEKLGGGGGGGADGGVDGGSGGGGGGGGVLGGGGSSGSGAGSGLAAGSGAGGGGSSSGDSISTTMRPIYHHKDLITRVLRLDKPYLYLTASKDGTVRTWNANTLQFQNLLTTGKNWLTDCCVMRRSNRLAVASMNRTLGFYDLNSNALIGEINEYSKRQAIPLCLEYVEKPADDREALVVGDDTGGITVMTCSDQWLACDGRSNPGAASTATTGSSISSNLVTPTNVAGSASLEAQGFSSRTKFKKHTDWVTRVKWVNDIRAIVATSLDTNISIIDIDRMVVKFEYNRHKKGVFDLVWCSSTRLIASCGMEREISIWNPYSSQRAVATLRGHTSSVVHLASDDDNYQIISVSSDNTFKVWDVRNHRCLQTWVDRYKSTGGAENRISALLFDPKQPCLVSGTTHLTRWPFKVSSDEEEVDEHKERPMCIASYNGVFHQVVTAEMSADSVVKTWSAETGDELCSFSNAHGQSPVTAISFDYPGRRLLTGSHDGTLIKMWNFSNGALVKQFLKEEEESSASNASGNGTGSTSVPGGTTTASVTNDLAFLGLESGDGDDDDDDGNDAKGVNSKNRGTGRGVGVLSGTTASSTAIPVSPRRRKPRDIMLLPPTFGIDWEGRRNGNGLSEYTELPSPTRTRLHPKGSPDESNRRRPHRPYNVSENTENPTAIQSARKPGDADPTVPPGEPPSALARTPRARRQSSVVDLQPLPSDAPTGPTYCEKEVTSILDIERNLRVGMGDYICQRFVCSVGWDRQVFVWADKNDESEALPVHILPNPQSTTTHPARRHTMDILALVYIPPAYIATAGLDGKIILWSINSGEFLAQVYQSTGSIDTMYFASRLEMLFASGETGQLVCIDRSMTPQAVLRLEHPQDEAVTALRCDRTNTHLVTGDAQGHVKVWELAVTAGHDGLTLDLCCNWRVGAGRVLGIDFIEHVRVTEPFLLLSCATGDVSLWTLDGVLVGCFGKHRSWQLGRPLTYQAASSSCEWPMDRPIKTKGQFIRCSSIAALNSGGDATGARESFLLEDSMPKPGEVWVCISGHRVRAMNASAKKAAGDGTSGIGSMQTGSAAPASNQEGPSGARSTPSSVFRRSSTNTGHSLQQQTQSRDKETSLASPSFLHQRLGEIASDVTDLITVVKVTRGEISCWDGHGHKPPLLKVIEMSDFVRKAGWIKQTLLSQYIGRTFILENNACFCATAISMTPIDANKPDRKIFALIDTNGQEHPVVPLNEAVAIARLKTLDAIAKQQQQHQQLQLQQGKQSLTAQKRLSATMLARDADKTESHTARLGNPLSAASEPASLDESLSASAGATATATSPIPPVTLTLLSTTVAGGPNALPLMRPKEKRAMGGLVPKRSTVRMRHDQSVDFRRIHTPEDIPKSYKTVIQQRLQHALGVGSGSNNSGNNAAATARAGNARGGARFDGILPE